MPTSTPIKATGNVIGDTLLLLTVRGVAGQATDTQRVKLNGPILLPTLVPLAIALGERPKVGKTYTLPMFDPASMTPKDVRIAVKAESVFVLNDSSVFDAVVLALGTVRCPDTIRAWKLGVGLRLERHHHRAARILLVGWTSRGASCWRRSCSASRSNGVRTKSHSRIGKPMH